MNVLTAVSDALTAASAVAIEFANPNSPDDKVAAEAALASLFVAFGVNATVAAEISTGIGDGIEAAKGGTNTVSDLTVDLTTAAAAHGVTVTPFELMLLTGFLQIAAGFLPKAPG